MQLDLLPPRTGGAAENMATDFLLLQRYPAAAQTHARFRHYDWRAPSFTFGTSQKIAYVREQLAALAPGERLDLCRRPTGGGVVDHREDWTYTLVVPRGHPLYDARATESYRLVHAALVESLRAQAQPVVLKKTCDSDCRSLLAGDEPDENPTPPESPINGLLQKTPSPAPTVCFTRPELYDVLHETTGAKVAGAAQKRTKHGLLFQGSLWKPTVAATVDWDAFETDFTTRLAALLEAEAVETPWPDLNEDELSALTDQYSSPEWIEYR
ncbi:MAG: lipoate--protein ligase family protein [Opitutaceae bacterium]|jgi:lipoate-protein ligase A